MYLGARSEGLEPSTVGAEIRCSIQLNYERKDSLMYKYARRPLQSTMLYKKLSLSLVVIHTEYVSHFAKISKSVGDTGFEPATSPMSTGHS